MSYIVVKENLITNLETVRKDELVKLKRWHTRQWYPIEIRRIDFTNLTTGLELTFLTNNMDLSANIVARVYKERWGKAVFQMDKTKLKNKKVLWL